eukprot:6539332-Prymnesium_polylepis.1
MGDSQPVEVLDGAQQLPPQSAHVWLGQGTMLTNDPLQITSVQTLEDEEHHTRQHEGVEQLHNARVAGGLPKESDFRCELKLLHVRLPLRVQPLRRRRQATWTPTLATRLLERNRLERHTPSAKLGIARVEHLALCTVANQQAVDKAPVGLLLSGGHRHTVQYRSTCLVGDVEHDSGGAARGQAGAAAVFWDLHVHRVAPESGREPTRRQTAGCPPTVRKKRLQSLG